jgi:hypothetical protein
MEPTDRARVHRVARLLDPSLSEHDLADDDTHFLLEQVTSGAAGVEEPPAAQPASPTEPQPIAAPPFEPGPAPHPAFRTEPPQPPWRGPAAPPPAPSPLAPPQGQLPPPTSPSDMHFPQMQPVRPPRTVPDAKPKKRNIVGLIWFAVVAFFVLRGFIEGFGGG